MTGEKVEKFQQLEAEHIARIENVESAKGLGVFRSVLQQEAKKRAKSKFVEDSILASEAVIGLYQADTSALLSFLTKAHSDRLPVNLREVLVSMIDGTSLLQLTPSVAAKKKGLTVDRVKAMVRRYNKITNAWVTGGGIDRPKDGLAAAMKATGLGKSTISESMSLEVRNELRDEREEFLKGGKTLAEFMARFKVGD